SRLLYTPAVSTYPGLELVFHFLCHLKTALLVGVLRQGKKDVRLRTIGIKAFISFLVVLVEEDHGILAFGNFKVRLRSVKPHHPRLGAVRGIVADGVDMYGNTQIGVCLVRDIRPLIQRNLRIICSRVDYLDIRNVLLDIFAHLECNGKRDILLLILASMGSRIVATMTGIDDNLAEFEFPVDNGTG